MERRFSLAAAAAAAANREERRRTAPDQRMQQLDQVQWRRTQMSSLASQIEVEA
jgi:hypothetical protein